MPLNFAEIELNITYLKFSKSEWKLEWLVLKANISISVWYLVLKERSKKIEEEKILELTVYIYISISNPPFFSPQITLPYLTLNITVPEI